MLNIKSTGILSFKFAIHYGPHPFSEILVYLPVAKHQKHFKKNKLHIRGEELFSQVVISKSKLCVTVYVLKI